MAVARLDAAASGADVGSESYTISAGSNRLLVVGFQQEHTSTGTRNAVTVTYGGQAMTKEVAIDNAAGSNDTEVFLFTLDEAGIVAASGTTLAFSTIDGSRNSWHAASYAGVDQTTPVPETSEDEEDPSSNNPLLGADITVADGAACAAVAGVGAETGADWTGGDLTEQTDVTPSSSQGSYADGLFATGESVSVSCEWASPNRTAICAIEIAASVVAGGEEFLGRQYPQGVMRGVMRGAA